MIAVLSRLQADTTMRPEDRREAIGAAHYCLLSPHEHVWTPEEQYKMARYVLWASQRIEAINQISAGILKKETRE